MTYEEEGWSVAGEYVIFGYAGTVYPILKIRLKFGYGRTFLLESRLGFKVIKYKDEGIVYVSVVGDWTIKHPIEEISFSSLITKA